MRVLQVIDSLLLGGAEVLLEQMVPLFARRGVACDVYSLNSADSPLRKSLIARGTRVYSPLQASVYSPLHVRSLAAHLKRESYDLVHVHLFPAQLWAALAVKVAKTKVPLLTTEHNTYSRRRRMGYKTIDRWMYAQYDRIACISDATAQALLKWQPKLQSKLRQCPNGVNVDRFSNVSAQSKLDLFSIKNDSFVILSVGRMEFQKDHATTIRALGLLPDVHLAIVGAGPMRADLQKLVENLGLVDRVHFLGRRSDVPKIMRAADVFVQSSRFEGFGIAALEAMASGLPVIATQVGGLADVVGDAGMLFEVGDEHQLAEHLKQLFSDRELRESLVQRGKARAEAFSLEKTIICYERLYREAIGCKESSQFATN